MKEVALAALRNMLRIRQFELRAEASYQEGKVGGFFHSYIGQEAIQVAVLSAFGGDHWYTTSYRCHALALLLGASPCELMAELYGKANGNAGGRGGSMHFYTERMLGGFGIVGGQIPVATGAAFSLNYLEKRDQLSFCFLGEGATVQGAFHESLNLASLWKLPVVYIIENNQWGMGTSVKRAVAVEKLGEQMAGSYGIPGITLDGMDWFLLYGELSKWGKWVLEHRKPVLIEAITERFRGHSISDPGLYRSREELRECQQRDPLTLMKEKCMQKGWLSEEQYDQWQREFAREMKEAVRKAEKAQWPSTATLEEGVFAP